MEVKFDTPGSLGLGGCVHYYAMVYCLCWGVTVTQVSTDEKTKAHRGYKWTQFLNVKSVLHAPASLIIGMWSLYCDEARTKQMNATHDGGCHNSAIMSSDASHAK